MVTLAGKRVYLDTNTIIYALEGFSSYANLKAGLLEPLDAGAFVAVTSELTIVETVVGARKAGQASHESVLRAFLSPTSNFIIEPISIAVLEKVIDLRSQFGFKVPDAIHLATGILTGCDVFVSNDSAWSNAGVQVIGPSNIRP
ncbi:MAG: type II toxin-antitoxin system VapC family toxin [Armatimonadetes bacterium]|nr:type II toxin-antitoxin system VapC family toxin [Armatimonadota bacterium]